MKCLAQASAFAPPSSTARPRLQALTMKHGSTTADTRVTPVAEAAPPPAPLPAPATGKWTSRLQGGAMSRRPSA